MELGGLLFNFFGLADELIYGLLVTNLFKNMLLFIKMTR